MPHKLPTDASCSRPSYAAQLKSVLKDKQGREKWKENVASSSAQLLPSDEDVIEGEEYFEFEETENWAEELKRAIPSDSAVPCPWAQEWHGRHEVDNWNEEFEGEDKDAAWTGEFNQREVAEDGGAWIAEFKKSNEEDSEHLAESAAELLSRLDMSDEKLRNSQFVTYLRGLANGQPVDRSDPASAQRAQEAFEGWREEFRQAIDPLVTEEDATWESWKKDWQQYEANGNGYEGFASREFRNYQFSPNNPFLTTGVARVGAASLRERILQVEADIQQTLSAALWAELGRLQGENEMDIQAIAAFQEALSLDQSLLVAWMGLALSCLNERCIPDAYEAIENWIRRNPSYSHIPINVQAGNRNSELLRCLLINPIGSDPHALILISVLQNLGHQHDQATESLRRAMALRPNDPVLLNRMGATMANSGHYADALSYYDQASSLGFDNPRIHYNRAVSLMSINRYAEAQRELVLAIQQQLPVQNTHNVRPDLRAGYQSIWTTMRLLCELIGNDDLAFEAEMRNLTPFL